MGALISLIAVAGLALLAAVGATAGDGLRFVLGVIVPGVAFAVFLFGIIFRVVHWARSPVPFRVTTTTGQAKSLPWIRNSEFENPSGLFGFINLPMIRRPKFVLGSDVILGISYDFNPYHVDDNPQNSVIGSQVNVWAGYSLTGQCQDSLRSDITVVAGFIHFSNVRTQTPNM